MEEALTGTVERVIFNSADGTFSVFSLRAEETGKKVTVAGDVGAPTQGRTVEVRGRWTVHPRFGRQFRAETMAEVRPTRAADIEEYLASGEITGIGPKMAETIVARFGSRTLEIMDTNIDALLSIARYRAEKIRKNQKVIHSGECASRFGDASPKSGRSAAFCGAFGKDVRRFFGNGADGRAVPHGARNSGHGI